MKLLRSLLVMCLISSHAAADAASAALSDNEARRVLQEAEGTFYLLVPPPGDIRLKIPLNPDQSPDFKNKLYPAKYVQELEELAKLGLITYRNKTKDFQFDSQSYEIMHTDKVRRMAEKTDQSGHAMISLGKRKFGRIVRNTEWQGRRPTNDDYREVLGVYDWFPTDVGKEWHRVSGTALVKEWKYRSMLRGDPFKGRYVFVDWEVTTLDKDFK